MCVTAGATGETKGTCKMANKDNTAALATFIGRKAQLDELLARIQAASDNHLGADADTVHWGHAGTMGHAVEQLAEIARFLNA